MSLTPPAPRRHVNTRNIQCEGYRREDGLLDIEARIIDTKTRAYQEDLRGVRQPDEPVHHMQLRLTIGRDLVVRAVEIETLSAPYPACIGASPDVTQLVGKSLTGGWRRAVQECLGGVKGCTHVRDLLLAAATSSFQTLFSWPEVGQAKKPRPRAPEGSPDRARFIDSCKGWAADGEIVATFYPEFYRKPT